MEDSQKGGLNIENWEFSRLQELQHYPEEVNIKVSLLEASLFSRKHGIKTSVYVETDFPKGVQLLFDHLKHSGMLELSPDLRLSLPG